MYCRVKPYEGDKPYAFFSYCHKDAPHVYPIIERLASEGYRVWYDDGIHPGADWTEDIAEHICKSAQCIAVVSEASVCSHNCRNEINFMIERGLNLLPIILSDFPMSLGIRLQLSTSQSIQKYAYSNDQDFYEKLFSAEGLGQCKGQESLIDETHGMEQERAAREKAEKQAVSQLEKAKALFSSPVEIGRKDKTEPKETTDLTGKTPDSAPSADGMTKESPGADPIFTPNCSISGERIVQAELPITAAYEEADEPTVLEERTVLIRNSRKQSRKKEIPAAALIELESGTVYPIREANTRIGRDDVQDIVIPKKTVGRLHAEILYNSQGFYIRDADSVNGTVLNGKQIEGLQPVPLGEFAMISFAEEGFLFLSGSTAQAALEMKKCAYLSCRETEETCALTSQDFILGRTNVWGGGTFQDRRASRFHGRICCGEDGKRILIVSEKETPNGTFLNGRFLSPGFIKELSPGDVIAIGHVYHIVYHEIVFKGEN